MTKNLLGAIILCITIILAFVFVMPAYDQLMSLRQVRTDRQDLFSQAELSRDSIVKLQSEYAKNSPEARRLMIALPVSKEVDYLQSSLERSSAISGVQLIALSISEPIKQGAYQKIPARADFSCRYPDCIRYIRVLEESLRLYDIDKISFSESSGAGSVSGLLNMSMLLTAYSIK